MELSGLLTYGVFTLTFVGIYAVLALGLNVQWGMTGLFNIGVGAFYAVGAYTSAILTSGPSEFHLGGFGMPFLIGLIGAVAVSAVLGLLLGLVTLNLRADYLAIATIGIAEIVRLFLKNEAWLTNGVRGIPDIPRPLAGLGEGIGGAAAFLVIVALAGLLVYWLIERANKAPWGRVLRALRENEATAEASGKSVIGFRLQAFVLGSAIMGLGGALYAHYVRFISPEAFEPMSATFLVWVMLIAGGSGNNRGAILGALVIWVIWSGTEILTGLLPVEWATRAGAVRVLLIGVLLQFILVTRPEGLLSETGARLKTLRKQATARE